VVASTAIFCMEKEKRINFWGIHCFLFADEFADCMKLFKTKVCRPKNVNKSGNFLETLESQEKTFCVLGTVGTMVSVPPKEEENTLWKGNKLLKMAC